MPYQPPKPDRPCPVCEADSSYRVWGSIGQTFVFNDAKKHFTPSPIVPLVCTVCGYIQFFTNPENFRD